MNPNQNPNPTSEVVAVLNSLRKVTRALAIHPSPDASSKDARWRMLLQFIARYLTLEPDARTVRARDCDCRYCTFEREMILLSLDYLSRANRSEIQ